MYRIASLSTATLILLGELAAIALPQPDEATFERFVEWRKLSENKELGDVDALTRYKAKLKANGVSEAVLNVTARFLFKRMMQEEADLWNKILTNPNPGFNTNENQLLADAIRDRKPGRALDVDMGQGRNAIFLAQKGWEVTGFDIADKGLALARRKAEEAGVRINTILTSDVEFDFGKDQWDLIAIIYPLEKRTIHRARDALKSGGIVVVEGFHSDVAKAGIRWETNELLKALDGFRVLRYEDAIGVADFGKNSVRLVKIIAQKP